MTAISLELGALHCGRILASARMAEADEESASSAE